MGAVKAGPYRTVEGRDTRFDIPTGADRSRFQPAGEGRWRYVTATRVKGLGRLSVTVGPRGDPEANLQMELQGWQACARMPAFRKDDVKCTDLNRSIGVVGLQRRSDGVRVAHAACWSRGRHFELALESAAGSGDPLNHPVFKKLMASFRSREAPLRHSKGPGAPK